MIGNKVVVIGGVGFVGRAVVNALSKAGYETTVVVRRPQRYREYTLFPNTRLAQLTSLKEVEDLKQVLKGADIVVNLIADLTSGAESITMDELVQVSQQIKKAVESEGVKRVLSLSQIGADANNAQYPWLCKLGEADAIMYSFAKAESTVLRAGLLLGEGDQVVTRFRKQLNRMPVLPVANANTRVQPLAVEDFAAALVQTIEDENSFGQKLDVAGEERLSLKELADTVSTLMMKEALIVPMCQLNAKFMVALGIFAPFQSVSKVQLLSLTAEGVTETDFATRFGFIPKSVEQTLSHYVVPNNMRERYNFMRQEAGRDSEELV